MRRSLRFGIAIGTVGCLALSVSAQTVPVPQLQQNPPVSLSPAMPPADPLKMAVGRLDDKAPMAANVDPGKYVLGVEDAISVRFWGTPEFDGDFTIRPDGLISLKLIGEVKADGLTPLQLEDAINKQALTMLKEPRASVNVIAVRSKVVYFDGEGIASPGPMPLTNPMKLLDALSIRGGFRDFAKKNKIWILRDGKPLIIGKSRYISYNNMISGKHPELNIELKPGDHVNVP